MIIYPKARFNRSICLRDIHAAILKPIRNEIAEAKIIYRVS